MPLDADPGRGRLVGIERSLGPHVGLQLAAHYGEADLSGAAGLYDLTMKYTSRPPPSYQPVEVTVRRLEAQPGAEGRLKTLAVAARASCAACTRRPISRVAPGNATSSS